MKSITRQSREIYETVIKWKFNRFSDWHDLNTQTRKPYFFTLYLPPRKYAIFLVTLMFTSFRSMIMFFQAFEWTTITSWLTRWNIQKYGRQNHLWHRFISQGSYFLKRELSLNCLPTLKNNESRYNCTKLYIHYQKFTLFSA